MKLTDGQCEKVSNYLYRKHGYVFEYDHDKPIYAAVVSTPGPYFFILGSLDGSDAMEKAYISQLVYDSLIDNLNSVWKDL